MSDWNEQIVEEFRRNGGTVQTAGFGRSLVLLHHVGAKSGVRRVTPVVALPTDDGSWLIPASKGGAPEHPGWYHNLRAQPDISIEIPDDGLIEVRARVLTGPARDLAWAQFTSWSAGFASYEKKTTRVIPVVELARRR